MSLIIIVKFRFDAHVFDLNPISALDTTNNQFIKKNVLYLPPQRFCLFVGMCNDMNAIFSIHVKHYFS